MSTGTGMAMISPPESEPVETSSGWHTGKRITFRFAFAYLVLYSLPLPIGALPWTEGLAEYYEKVWHAIVPWIGRHVLNLSTEVSTRNTGSGDRMYDWILVGCYLTIAVTATLIWSALDRRRSEYGRLEHWLRLYVRLSLAYWMMVYGGAKVIPSQFPQPFLTRLVQPYGESSPMGLLWTWMGASPSYTIFTGCVELLGGILLILPRTAMIGGVVSMAAMTHIFVLNMCYDVPVKLFSFHLILMSAFVLLPHGRRIAFFLANRAVQPATTRPLFERRRLDRLALVIQAVLGAYLVGASVYGGYQAYTTYGGGAPKPPLYGIWAVEELAVNGESRPPLLTDQTRWRRAIFQRPGFLILQPMTGPNQAYRLELDVENRKMALTKEGAPEWRSDFSFEETEPGLLTLDGQFEEKPTRAKLVRVDESQFLLRSRGFHWISEVPFNR